MSDLEVVRHHPSPQEALSRQRQIEYWRSTLDGAPALLALPTDRPRPRILLRHGELARFELSRELTAQLRELGDSHGMTLFAVVATAFSVLLGRHSGQDDISLGYPAGRLAHSTAADRIGAGCNTLVLRTRLNPLQSFSSLLRQVRTSVQDADEHGDVPFEQLAQTLQPGHATSHSALCQVILALGKGPIKPAGSGTSFDLTLHLNDSDDLLQGTFEYSSQLFDQETIERMVGHLRVLLRAVARNPFAKLYELPLLTQAETHQLLEQWHVHDNLAAPQTCLHELFEAQVVKHPDAVAVVFEEEQLSYEQLNAKANQLAHHLIAQGVKPETLVAICVERGLDMVVGILGVLKAGGAYVPLDPAYPRERLEYMLRDTGTKLLLTQSLLVDALPRFGGQVLCLDRNWDEISTRPTDNPPSVTKPSHLAYCIYTSGSTGKPKGVLVTNSGIGILHKAQADWYGVTRKDRIFCLLSFGFDAFVADMFLALGFGARFVLARSNFEEDFVEEMKHQGATIVTLPPSLLAVSDLKEVLTLRHVISAGERCIAKHRRHLPPGCSLVNGFGPTESTIWATAYRVELEIEDGDAVPIGRPIDGVSIHVLDGFQQAVPVGVIGEICISGESLARGYLNMPEATAERFVANPYGPAGSRLYRTGDIGAYKPCGNIVLHGRNDSQVKIRGFRIDRDEVRGTLVGLAEVQDAAIGLHNGAGDSVSMVAFVVVSEAGRHATPEELRAKLAERIPKHMIPSMWRFVSSIPKSLNGKADLSGIADAAKESLTDIDAMPSPLERLVAREWARLLKLNRLSRDDNFFEVGGDSIMAVQIANEMKSRLGIVVYAASVMDFPSVAGFAAFLLENYPELASFGAQQGQSLPRIDQRLVDQFVHALPMAKSALSVRGAKNPPAAFIFSPPRSGSTLLRSILAGSPQLFAPGSLELLAFGDMDERRRAFSGRDAFWRKGAVDAVKVLKACSDAEADRHVKVAEEGRLPTQDFYAHLQTWAGNRLLLDKSSGYAMHRAFMERAETQFHEAKYIHLVRNPSAMISSFERAKTDLVYARKLPRSFHRRHLAELVWLVCHRNIIGFLEDVSPDRHITVKYEELVEKPAETIKGVCEFLQVAYHDALLNPYDGQVNRMTNGLGDARFHEHVRIDSSSASSWRNKGGIGLLGEPTVALAHQLGYTDLELGQFL